MKLHKWDLAICAVLSAALLVFVLELRDITPIARIYPVFVIAGSYLMILIVLLQTFFRARKPVGGTASAPPMEKSAAVRIVVYCLAVLAYIVLMERLGYFLSSVAFMVFSLVYQKNRSRLLILILPLAFTLAMYFVFSQFLYVTLPVGTWIEMLL